MFKKRKSNDNIVVIVDDFKFKFEEGVVAFRGCS
jgi:hypothetical protein